ncbi:MAG: phosphoribulokinase, partial [Pseudomonadota bacterium]|nr:phosphoribulokinase [Pseudomonadota bacterium]
MSKKHPIVAVTGSSGSGTSTVKSAFERIFLREGINPAVIEGDSFHRYTRTEIAEAIKRAEREGRSLSHFGAEANLFDKLEESFKSYGKNGTGKRRLYLHTQEEAAVYPGLKPGDFTPWEDIRPNTDLLFYEGLHGGLRTDKIDIASHVDVLIGVVPIVNLEWIQKIHRDKAVRGYTTEAVVDTIMRRMRDYVQYITPQ